MVAQQEAIVGENSVVVVDQESNKSMMMIKGKRTKRSRPLSPLALTMSSTPTTTTDEGGSAMSEEWTAPNSAATSEEEHDMAHCLILLAQGTNQSTSNFNNTTTNNIGTTPSNKGSMGISSSYECKTCNKSFASFQALGGHRASHKKPKTNTFATLSDLKKSPSSLIFSLINHDNNQHHHHDDGTTLSLQMANSTLCARTTNNNTNKTKVHECGICGAEFSSGQALGGHMRRHRPIGMTTATAPSPSDNSVTLINAITKNNNNNNNVKDVKTTRNHFSLDLNLPAPEDEHHQSQQRDSSSSKFVFSSNEKTLVFATASSQLVDCHY